VAEAVAGAGLFVLVAGLGGQVEGDGVLDAGVFGLPGGEENLAQAVVCFGFAGPVTHRAEHGQGLLKEIGGLLGAALIYGDGAVTPAISVLSALEGLNMATAAFQAYVLPAAVVILNR